MASRRVIRRGHLFGPGGEEGRLTGQGIKPESEQRPVIAGAAPPAPSLLRGERIAICKIVESRSIGLPYYARWTRSCKNGGPVTRP